MIGTKIEWTDHTWNPWVGCHRVSEGCRHCYMFRARRRFGQDPEEIRRTSPATWCQVRRFGAGSYVFVCSWSDFFLEEADPWRDEAWRVIENRPDVTWVVVTKRPERIAGRLPWGDGEPWPNVIGMVTAEDQGAADLRVALLLQANLAARGVSVEPMLGPVKVWARWFYEAHTMRRTLHWVICGGESGPGARPMHPDWARSLRDRCQAAGVPFFFKQWGEWIPAHDAHVAGVIVGHQRHSYPWGRMQPRMARVGKKFAGRALDGRTWEERPR